MTTLIYYETVYVIDIDIEQDGLASVVNPVQF